MLDHPNRLDVAIDLTRKCNFDKAELIFQAILGHDPLNSDALFHYGFPCAKTRRPELAVGFYAKALVTCPDVIDTLENLEHFRLEMLRDILNRAINF